MMDAEDCWTISSEIICRYPYIKQGPSPAVMEGALENYDIIVPNSIKQKGGAAMITPPDIANSTIEERRAFIKAKFPCIADCDMCGLCKVFRGQDAEHACASPHAARGYRFSDAMRNPGFIGIGDIQNTYLPLGFSHFKIEGRSLGSALILEFLLYYLTKPEYQLNVREEIYLSSTLDLF